MVDIRSNSNEPTPSAGSNNFHRQSYPKFRNWLGLILAGEPFDTANRRNREEEEEEEEEKEEEEEEEKGETRTEEQKEK
ncbi:hypothetical protein HZH68_009018 [Vespula germanica]|uniref:Uncharacterized protein n=1 Tax=Vespula germanica TaxID=30212 RepID=A0A834K257_VESGE|nr:hypothetical protein HZH68_009018 [Vespula germanica]